MAVLKYIWGKARESNIHGEKKFSSHPLICHLIDVAAVAEVFWDNIFSKYLKTHLSRFLFKDQENFRRWLAFLAGVHDLGKATPIFQDKIPELAEKLSEYDLATYSGNKYHSLLSGEILYQHLTKDELNINIGDPQLIFTLKYIIGGHHGFFPKAEDFVELSSNHIGEGKWEEIQKVLIQVVADFCEMEQNAPITFSETSLNRGDLHALLVFIAGFISVVDWIGSNDEFFHFFSDFDTLSEFKEKYFELSRSRAKRALKEIGWDSWKTSQEENTLLSFNKVFPFIEKLRPLQEQIIDNLKHISSPCLTIIEAPMGEGKTEAALYLEHYLEQKEGLQGAYIALPTQATANQMFLRVKDFLSNIKKGLRVNLHLLHGNAVLSDQYKILQTNSKNYDKEESNIVADRWFTSRKRGLISPFGVGTVDQTLLSVLPIRHFFVRLFGLAGKIIIIDEVHSYDIYMSTLMEYLLYWLKLLGSSVILLSATLPSFKRKKLIRTYYTGTNEIKEEPYPRVSICSEEEVRTFSFETAMKKQNNESVVIKWIDEDSLPERLIDYLEKGGNAAVIRNKVKSTQDLFLNLQSLKEVGFDINLLHSRFPFIRRDEIEKLVLERFGKNRVQTSVPQLIISTQIIEQSLDLDFDLMISDLAPIDLLFQRMGRLHRHSHDKDGNLMIRPDKLKRPEFWIIMPRLNNNSIPRFTNPIYSEYILLKTFLYLRTINTISIPDDLEKYIELVYGENSKIPDEYKESRTEWENEFERTKDQKDHSEGEKKLTARYNLISDPSDEDFFEDLSGYLEDNTPQAQESLQSLTRITFPSINLVCLYRETNSLFFDRECSNPVNLNKAPNHDDMIKILDYTVRISNYRLFRHFTDNPSTIPKKWKANPLIYNVHYVILSNSGDKNQFFFDIEQLRCYLTKELGIYIEYKRKE